MNAPTALPSLWPALLGQVVLCAAPVFDRARAVMGLRVSARGLKAGGYPLSTLADALAPLFAELAPLPLFICAADASLDGGLRELALPSHVTLEFDATLATLPPAAPLLHGLHGRGVRLALRGRPPRSLAPEVLPLFHCAIVAQDEDRRLGSGTGGPEAAARRVPFFAVGMRNLAETRAAFERGAAAVIGWPVEDRLQTAPRNAQPAHLAVLELIRLLRENAEPPQFEAVLKRDATLAFRVLELANAPAMGLAQPVTSFQHALLLLGYQRLQRWLIVMLASGSRAPDLTPLMSHALGRGLLLDHLAQQAPAELRNDLFLAGAFSLLDRITGTPFDDLFRGNVLPEALTQALLHGQGPLHAFLQLARASERIHHAQVAARLAALAIDPAAYNRAVLLAAAGTRSMLAALPSPSHPS